MEESMSKHKSRRSSRRRDEDDSDSERKSHSHQDRDRENGERHRDRGREREKSSREKDRERGKKGRVRDRDSRRRQSWSESEREVSVSVDEDGSSDDNERERVKEKHWVRVKDKEKDKEKHRQRSQEDGERERKESRERLRHKEREREREREREKEKEREREREMEKERECEREREREKEKERERERERVKEKERERRERERVKEKERERREREREREKRDREKEKAREREKMCRESERKDYSSDDQDDRKKRRRDEDSKRDRERERSSKSKDREGVSSPRIKGDDDTVDASDKKKEKQTTWEEDMEEEQRKLDEEMEKRRRRVQEWQELRRKREEAEREKLGVSAENADMEAPKSGKTWTLEGESDDEDEANAATEGNEVTEMDADADEGPKPMEEDVTDSGIGASQPASLQNGDAAAEGDDEVDPLDAFMNSMVLPEVEKLNNSAAAGAAAPMFEDDKSSNVKKGGKSLSNGDQMRKGPKIAIGRIIPGEDSDSDYGDIENEEGDPLKDEDDGEFMKRVKKTKAEKLSLVDHSKIEYPSFRKNLYIEVKEISRMSPEEVTAYRKELELKLHGKDVPKPVKTWPQTGLSSKVIDTIKKLNFEKPMPIQAQALPIIMSGRDCIGIAKTGSGKTLAFVLPMLRHIKDQPPLMPGDGPVGLIMAPTRELVQQIHSDIKKFTKVMGISCVPVYGGAGVAQQISELKRGAEIVVCTPGRMIDILCTSSGKITNLRRVTYLVLDEADRMFDMGFEPQITRIVQNTRPDRQTVLFSATFPRQVEILGRKVLNKPVEIQVGGRSVVNKDITQLVEMRPESERFLRLLEILGEWYEKGKILIFVHTQEKCDALFRDLLKHGYPCLSLHGAKDQTDRESTLADFKSNVCNLLIATSVAARGLDVKELELVINFDVPNHYEDYVHRVGRTGRAGRKGYAVSFISEEDARYAPDLVKALELSEQVVPGDLKALADGFMAKVNQGLEQAHGTGYGGSGFKFNEEEEEVRKAAKKAQAKEYGFEEDKSDSEDEDEGVRKAGGDLSQQAALAQVAALAAASKVSMAAVPTPLATLQNVVLPVPGIFGLTLPTTTVQMVNANDGAARAAALAAALNLQHNLAKIQADAMPEHYEAGLEINDFPQNARWKVTHKETLGPISEWTGASITTRGQYYPPGKITGPGERKLYLFIEGPTEQSVKRAKAELKRVLEDITMQAFSLPGSAQPGRYSVV